jgi:hypothetical protein
LFVYDAPEERCSKVLKNFGAKVKKKSLLTPKLNSKQRKLWKVRNSKHSSHLQMNEVLKSDMSLCL